MSAPLRITFILPYAGLAGGIRVIAIYAARLQQRGHHVHLVSSHWAPPGRRARVMHSMRRWTHRLCGHGDEPSHLDTLSVPHTRIGAARPVRDSDVPDADVVIATWWETAPWVAALASNKGAKFYFVQDYGAHDGQPMHAVADTWRLPMRKLVISRFLMDLIEQHCGRADMVYLPNAVDRAQFHAPPRGKQVTPTVGFQFNPAPQKGCDTMIRAIKLARRSIPSLRVKSYGPGNAEIDMALPEGTEHWQYAPEHELHRIYASCDAWLFGSRAEGFGLPILEAMACGTPVIGTPAGAAPELIPQGGGVMVPLDDAAAMADALVALLTLPDRAWRERSGRARALAAGMDWTTATDRFEAALFHGVRSGSMQHSTTTATTLAEAVHG